MMFTLIKYQSEIAIPRSYYPRKKLANKWITSVILCLIIFSCSIQVPSRYCSTDSGDFKNILILNNGETFELRNSINVHGQLTTEVESGIFKASKDSVILIPNFRVGLSDTLYAVRTFGGLYLYGESGMIAKLKRCKE